MASLAYYRTCTCTYRAMFDTTSFVGQREFHPGTGGLALPEGFEGTVTVAHLRRCNNVEDWCGTRFVL